MRADLAAAIAATRKRAQPLLRGVVRVMTDLEVVNAMDALVQLMCHEPRRTSTDEIYNKLCMEAWRGVREYVSAYARGDSRVNPRVSGGTKKKGRR